MNSASGYSARSRSSLGSSTRSILLNTTIRGAVLPIMSSTSATVCLARGDLGGLEAGVGDHEHDVGERGLLERAGERVDELVRQLADEADRVGEHVVAVVVAVAPRGRVERLEQAVAHRDLGVGERVEERRLAGVGVAGERDERHAGAEAPGALRAAGARHLLDAAAQRLDALAHHAAVDLHLGLARPAHVDAGAQTATGRGPCRASA